MKKIHISELWTLAKKTSYKKFIECCVQIIKGFIPDNLDIEKNLYLSEIKPVRSLSQNAYYHVILNYLEEKTGNDHDTLHKRFRKKFLGFEIVDCLGEEEEKIKSTTKLDTKQFTDYIEKICVFMADFGIEIPQPKDPNFNDFLEHYKNYL